MGADIGGELAVANGFVFVNAGDRVWAFDASGSVGCSNTPKTCTPVWSTAPGIDGLTTISATTMFLSAEGKVYAVDATGKTNCSGSPAVCSPLWSAVTGSTSFLTPAAVADGKLFVTSADAKLYAFDSTASSCSGTPKVCGVLWSASLGTDKTSRAAVAQGVVYVAEYGVGLLAFDAGGVTTTRETSATGPPRRRSSPWRCRG